VRRPARMSTPVCRPTEHAWRPANELWAEVSPDGRWVAYDSDESGQFEIYVRPIPDAYRGGRWQISSGGGRQPVWSRDGRELFYRDFTGAVLALPVTSAPTFAPGRSVRLFDGSAYVGGGAHGSGRTYDVSPDASRFLMIKIGSADRAPAPLVVVLNWFEELRRLVPVP
jgi:eukaryotic-like serine/threonine-protein kinase